MFWVIQAPDVLFRGEYSIHIKRNILQSRQNKSQQNCAYTVKPVKSGHWAYNNDWISISRQVVFYDKEYKYDAIETEPRKW